MSSTAAKCLLFIVLVCVVQLDCELQQHRPTINTVDGDLILEPARDKNIYLRPNGAQSTIFISNINVLKTYQIDAVQYQASKAEDIDQYFNGPNGILQRLFALETKSFVTPDSTQLNITAVRQRVNNLDRKVKALQNQIKNIPSSECDSHPCEHGGTCLKLVSGYHCLCTSNWEGRNCDQDVNECRNFAGTELGCQNGAKCVNKPGTYECLCTPNWLGVHCTTKAKDCSAGDFEMCGHGTCVPVTSGEGIRCICHQGWTTNAISIACLTDVDECDLRLYRPRCSVTPKVECVNVAGSFRCGECPAGYEGDGYVCNDIDECISTRNGGCSSMVTCHNTIGSRICGSCPPGYEGDGVTCTYRGSCNIEHGGCHTSAQCTESPSPTGVTVQCMCPEGMKGDGRGVAGCYVSSKNNTSGCENNPCGSHGRCYPVRSGFTCICSDGYGGARCDAPVDSCALNPCQNGGVCRQHDGTGFRCECTAQYSGSLCQVKLTTCGGVLTAEEGSIAYPMSNTTTYNNNAQCAWLIRTDTDKVLNVTFSKFQVESSPECSGDFLQLHDGRRSSSPLIGRFCGNTLPKGGNIVSSHNNLYLWFHSDETIAKAGFTLHWTSMKPACGGEVDASTHGHISSPGSPGPYPPNRDCYWHLIAPPGKRIIIHFFALDIEAHASCDFDYLAIYDGEHTSAPLLSKYCNSTQPPPVCSASSHLLIHFHSDAYGSGNGFQIAYAPVEGVPGCGGYLTADRGEIVAPSLDGAYLNNLLCEYKIKTAKGTKIKLDFKLFKLHQSYMCKGDYLKIYDGPSSDSQLVGKFCGTTHPATYTSSSNTLYFEFKSDQSESDEGYRITYEAICGKNILGDSGVVTSPLYPFSYPHNKDCVYIIETEPGNAIQLTFQNFDIEGNKSSGCLRDYVEVRDGADVDGALLARYCGRAEHAPPALTSTHNYMYIRFKSDESISGSGFYANYTSIDTTCGGIYRHTTGEITYPPPDNDTLSYRINCLWLLIAPESMRIQLTWNTFVINCGLSYLELLETNHDNRMKSVGRYCGDHTPPALITSTNRLTVKFLTASATAFSLSYRFIDESTSCGGHYAGTHGYIHSPGWPESYESNLNCTWIITVIPGQQIALNITYFHLESTYYGVSCDQTDYLEIRNGRSESSPLYGRFCDKFESKRITSLANELYLHFHSDYTIEGRGFSIEWDSTITGCGGTLTSSTGSITSPNYPHSYYINAECFYRIAVSAGSRIRISISELDVEVDHPLVCSREYIDIYNGRDSNAPSLGRYCKMTSELANIETTSNYAYIRFRSDHSNYSNRHIGFQLSYVTICNNNLTGRYGVIESPDYPNAYPMNLHCLWNIQVPKGNRINVTLTDFRILESEYYVDRFRYSRHRHRWDLLPDSLFDNDYRSYSGDVTYDYYEYYDSYRRPCPLNNVQMKEKSELTFSRRFCGMFLPEAVTTKSDSFQIQFKNSLVSPGTYTGFRLEWISFGCGGHIRKESGTIALGKSSASEKEMECEWLIETSPGTSINITFTDIYMSNNCTSDAIEIYNGQDTKAPLLTKICHRKQVSIQSDSNYMLIYFVKNSTMSDVYFTSEFHTTYSKCGGTIKSISGFIYSKNYPRNYDHDLDCIWYIEVPENHRIELNFLDFDLWSKRSQCVYCDVTEDTDCGDSVLIYDESNYSSSSNYTYRICPSSRIRRIVSKHHRMVVQFKSDSEGLAKGFKAVFSVLCGGLISATQDGIITSHDYLIPLNRSCVWTITAPTPDQKISLTITHMSLAKDADVITNRHCPSSFVRVLDGNDDEAPLIGEYCGRKVPPMLVSHGDAITIHLGSYTGRIAGQFSVHYSPILNACGGTLTAEEGSIASPLYPSPYPVDVDCEWLISTSPGNTAYVTFERFDLEYSEGCNEDYVELRENDGGDRLLGAYCGSVTPTNTTVATKIYIKFHSSSRTSGAGFLLHYGYLRNNDIQGERGVITSPLYPVPYVGVGEYNWRISVSNEDVVTVIIDSLEIPVHPYDAGYNKLRFYDGIDNTAPILEQLHGVIDKRKTIQPSSNVVYISLNLDKSNTGSIFHITWTRSSLNEDFEERINCGSNRSELLLPGQESTLKSPNYPGEYRNNLNCEWLYRTQFGRHLSITFDDFDLEERPGCVSDSVSIYSADSPGNWKAVKTACESTSFNEETNTSLNMKIKFITDSSITKTGFLARVRSKCGGLVTDLSGEVGVTWFDVYTNYTEHEVKCEWTIKVRPGRTLLVRFNHFNISSNDNTCATSVVLHNGDSAEAPLLTGGRYCGYEHEQKTDIVTSSNTLFVSYTSVNGHYQLTFQTFSLFYEEEAYECGSTSILTSDHSWETINSPNYPSLPLPYSECVWILTGPPGEILRIDFIDRFDVQYTEDCMTEFVEVRDGSSSSSPSKGRYCGRKTSTIKTSSNTVYIKYSTQLTEPGYGFKANISIDVCGGTIFANSGEVKSPGYPHLQELPYGTCLVCEWHIIGLPEHAFQIKPQDVNVPVSLFWPSSKVDIEETNPVNKSVTILKTLHKTDVATIETSSNSFTLKFTYCKPVKFQIENPSYRGFRIKFDAFRAKCYHDITISEGYLTTPSYPQYTKIKFCSWYIKVPNKFRRIRLELIDFDLLRQTVYVLDVFKHYSSSKTITNDNSTTGSLIYKTLGNELVLVVALNSDVTSHRFKAKFTSAEPALCGGELSAMSQELASPHLQHSYTCEWHYSSELGTGDHNNLDYKSIFLTVQINSSMTDTRCEFYDPRVIIRAPLNNVDLIFERDICVNTEVSYYRIPSTVMDITAEKGKVHSLNFYLSWKVQPCGGTVHISSEPVNIINTPDAHSGTLDCAWILIVPNNYRAEFQMEGEFLFKCDDEFLTITHGVYQHISAFGNYCRDHFMNSPLITNFPTMYVQYHTKVKNNNNTIKLTARTIIHQCGGLLTHFDRSFTSPNYPKSYNPNEECAWEIRADLGYRISLQFIDRFVVEDKPNCTKDVVIIYDWRDGTYEEIARVCGRQAPLPYNSTLNRLKVVLRTDADANLDGFKARWTPFCGGKFIATDEERILYSPSYPEFYADNMHCTYELFTADQQKILLVFHDFELEGTMPECEFDNLTVTAAAYYLDFHQIYCGSKLPSAISKFQNIILEFKSGYLGGRKGFKISYTRYKCGGTVTNTTVISSSFGDDTYSDDMNCTWIVNAPPTKIVVVKFFYIDLENRYNCINDHIALYNGQYIDGNKRLALLCGNKNSISILSSTENSMVIEFITDSSITYRGFKAAIYFSYSEAVGCGGRINLEANSSHILKSPLISNVVYENFLDCSWTIISPPGTVVKIIFSKFHIAPCKNINQTAVSHSECDCDFVDIKDGLNPNSLVIGTYCGHATPPSLISSANLMSVRLSTDGERVSSGFEATLTVQQTVCGQTVIPVSFMPRRYKSPGYDTGSVPAGLHCVYRLDVPYRQFRVSVISLDLRAPVNDSAGVSRCFKDRLLIWSAPFSSNITTGNQLIMNHEDDFFVSNYFERGTHSASRFELCGHKEAVDFYMFGSTSVSLITFPETDSEVHRGVEIEVAFVGHCGRNYTEAQGRVKASPFDNDSGNECYTLITAPQNFTIAAYFLDISFLYTDENLYLEIFDGDKPSARKITKIMDSSNLNPVFTTSRYMLLHIHLKNSAGVTYDMNYVTTDKGSGCGGRLSNTVGAVTSPSYPNTYRRDSICEWVLETPVGSRLMLRFTVFDLGIACEQNNVQLVDSRGAVVRTFCSEPPADYTSDDHYVKILFRTSINNSGRGWSARFVATEA